MAGLSGEKHFESIILEGKKRNKSSNVTTTDRQNHTVALKKRNAHAMSSNMKAGKCLGGH